MAAGPRHLLCAELVVAGQHPECLPEGRDDLRDADQDEYHAYHQKRHRCLSWPFRRSALLASDDALPASHEKESDAKGCNANDEMGD